MKRMNLDTRRRGVALIYAVFGAFVAASMILVMLTAASVTRTRAELKADELQARYLAEGGVEAAKKEIQEAIANWKTPPTQGSVTIEGAAVEYTIEVAGDESIVTDVAGIQTIVQPYRIDGRAVVGDAAVRAHRLVRAESTPIFQFAVFYDGDLEIHPAPSMTLAGRVHTNENMYLGCGSTLTLDTNYVHAVGEIFRQRKDTGPSGGAVDIRKWVANPFAEPEPDEFVSMNSQDQMADLGVASESGYDSTFQDGFDADGDGSMNGEGDWLPFGPGALDLWSAPDGYDEGSGHTVLTGEHGIGEAVTPSPGSIKMFDEHAGGDYAFDEETREYEHVGDGNGTHAKGFYHDSADLAILVAEDGTSFTAVDGGGFDVAAQIAGAVNLATIFDARQGGNVPVVVVDLAALASTGAFPSNGLLYCSHYGMGTGTASKGIQLVNGSELYRVNGAGSHERAPLTVVTEGSAFIQGDYNTVTKVGAAVIADAVNLLSNAWTGTKDGTSLPLASNTTYNVAMITGNHVTTGASYNGGLENLPRFHEDWSHERATITGSFVNTWLSAYATGEWRFGGNRYKPPVRIWSYETAFNRVSNLPPYTPMAVSAEDVVSW